MLSTIGTSCQRWSADAFLWELKLSSFSSFSARIQNIGTMLRGDEPRAPSSNAPVIPPTSQQPPAEKSLDREHVTAQAAKGRSRFLAAFGRQGAGKNETAAANGMSSNLPGMSIATEKHLKEVAPELYGQLQTLCRSGWQIEERHFDNRATQPGRGRIVIDPRITSHGMVTKRAESYAHLCSLAHQVGCALHRPDVHRPPISLETRGEYVRDNLQREAAGVLNELHLRHAILQRTAGGLTGKKDIWSGRGEEFKVLADLGQNASSYEEARQAIAKKLGEMRGANGKTYASLFERQYDLFQISDKTDKEVVQHVQACFNETGIALPADQIKAHGHRPGGPYYWMTQEGLASVRNENRLGFQVNGFTENDEIGNAIMTALSSGTKWASKPGDEWHYHTYHDSMKNRVCGILVKFGERPGEIVQAIMQDPVGLHAIHSPDGRYNYLNLQHANTLIPERAKAFASHGIPPNEIPAAIMTAMAAGISAPEQTTDEGWNAYRFRYKDSPDEMILHVKQEPDGQIRDFKLVEKQDTSSVAPSQSAAFDAILAGSEGDALRSHAAKLGVDAKELLATVIKDDNKKRFSFERPGFGVYRADVNGQSITLLAKMEHGQIAEVGASSELDRLFAHFPLQEQRCAQLGKDGWKFRSGVPEGGTYCMRHSKEIVIDPTISSDVFSGMRALAHEMAHAAYKQGNSKNVKDYVDENALDEGNSLFAEYQLLDEAASEYARAGIKNFLAGKPYHEEALGHYMKWKEDRAAASDARGISNADQDARDNFGKIYRGLRGSASPDGSNYEMRWRTTYRTWQGEDAAQILMERLQSQKPPIEILDRSGKSVPPSFNNVQIIRRLPIQPGLQEPKIIFIDKNTFVRQGKGMDLQQFEGVVKNGLDFGPLVGSAAVTQSPNGSNLQRATYSYTKDSVPHTVHLDFGDDGRVFNIDVVISPAKKASEHQAKPENEKQNEHPEHMKHSDFIDWMKDTLS